MNLYLPLLVLVWVAATCGCVLVLFGTIWLGHLIIVSIMDRARGDERLASDVMRRLYDLEGSVSTQRDLNRTHGNKFDERLKALEERVRA